MDQAIVKVRIFTIAVFLTGPVGVVGAPIVLQVDRSTARDDNTTPLPQP